MTPSLSNKGYLMLPLPFNKKQKSFCVHRIIAETFIDMPKLEYGIKLTVNHIDGNKQNNNISNLEWMTYSENNYHAYKVLGKVSGIKGKTGEKSKLSKAVKCFSDDGINYKTFVSITDATKTGLYSLGGISQAVNKNKKYKKLNWIFI